MSPRRPATVVDLAERRRELAAAESEVSNVSVPRDPRDELAELLADLVIEDLLKHPRVD